MKAKELLKKVTETGYSMPTMKKIFCMARNEAEADKVAELMDRCKTEEEILAAIGGATNIYEALDNLK